jgi:glutathione S-transferase
MRYRLYYWPEIQGRGEFVRLALEYADADYVDVWRTSNSNSIRPKLKRPPFAPPYLVAGKLVIAQTANILLYLGPRLRLAPRDEAGRLWAHQLQLTIADWLVEVHDTHHPIGSGLYYEEQRREARRRAADFRAVRLPKYLDYFEGVLRRSGGPWLLGKTLAYPDLSLFQMVAGLRYAFPRTVARLDRRYPRTVSLHQRIAEHPRLARYLASPRRIPFNRQGIFRHYPELDQIRNNSKKT